MMRTDFSMPLIRAFLPFCLLLILFLGCETVLAQENSADSHGRFFGVGQPKAAQDLPPGRFRQDLESLPAKAKGRALGWLQGFSFPAEDVTSLRVNPDGSVHYADTFTPDAAEASGDEALVENAALDPSEVFQLHSRPGSSNVVFLDFDGHNLTGTGWSIGNLEALPFDPSQNDSPPTVANFTTDELNRIAEIWHRISEDYAPFNIDVTTEEPAVFTPTTGHILFTHDSDATGKLMPSQGAGGVAFVNVFGRSDYAYYSPALVYYTNLAISSHGVPSYNAEAGSHELGHNIGLSHDGVIGGTAYYAGHGNGLVSWAPIMGFSYYNSITQWNKGEYANANNAQDDLAIIAGDLGYVGDDHGDTAALATALVVEANGDILVSSPEMDPDNLLPENKGIIDDRTDVDWFYLDVAVAGSLNMTATPAWHSFTVNERRGSNLDIELALFDSNLTLLAVGEPGDDTSASVTAPVVAGRYYLQVDGVENHTNSDYSDYNSMGMFFLEGSIPAGPPDNTPPSPATMFWQSAPQATGPSSIDMTAAEATDDSGSVEYYFTCVAGGSGCSDSGWQASRSYTASGLDAETFYAYKVRARDGSGNQNGDASTMGDTTDAAPVNQAPVASAAYTPEPAVISKGKAMDVTLDGAGSSDADGTIAAWSWKDASGTVVGETATVTLRLREGTFGYTLTVTDDNGATDNASLSISVTKGGGGGKGKPPKR